MRTTLSILLALALLAVAVRPAHAEVHREEMVFEFGGGNGELRRAIENRLLVWFEALPTTLQAGTGWDETAFGPFGLVRSRLAVQSVQVDPELGTATATLDFDDAKLRSGKASLEAIGQRVSTHISGRINALRDSMRQARIGPLEEHYAKVRLQEQDLSVRVSVLERDIGNPTAELARLQREYEHDARAYSQAVVDRAVTAHELEAAREALKRARKVLALERAVAKAEQTVSGIDPSQRAGDGLQLKLDQLLTTLDEARAAAPPLEAVRARIFDLEVRLVGLDSRIAALEASTKALKAKTVELRELARRHATTVAALDAARVRLEAARKARESAEIVFTAPLFSLIRPLGGR